MKNTVSQTAQIKTDKRVKKTELCTATQTTHHRTEHKTNAEIKHKAALIAKDST